MIFWYLLIGHVLCDYPLQGEFLAKGKNHLNPLSEIPWYQCLFAHSLIHAGAVTLITGNFILGFTEFVLHSLIDYSKSEGVIGYNVDQLLHISCKVFYVICLLQGK